MTQRIVVVGAGLGGLRAAEQLRTAGFAGDIEIVGDEPHLPYTRPPLSKEGLAGGLSHETVVFRRKASVDDVTWRLGESVVAADLAARTLTLGDGAELGYDGLVAATGVSARRLPLDAPPQWRHVVRTLDDATALRAALKPGSSVVVIGAGFIGCEVAATARLLGCSVDVVDPLEVPLLRPLGIELGSELQRRHEKHGVRFHLGRTIAALRGDATGPHQIVLDDGTELDVDVVVEAVGSVPNVSWLSGNSLDLTDGVLCDDGLRPVKATGPVRTAVVVGDIARFPNLRFDERPLRVEHWSIPTDTGRRAGAVLAAYLAGEGYAEVVDAAWDVVPSFWSDQFDIRLQSYGMPGLADPDGIRVLEGDLHDECVVGYHRGDELVGVVGLGMLRVVNSYRDKVGHPVTV